MSFGKGKKIELVFVCPPIGTKEEKLLQENKGQAYWFWCVPCKTHHKFTTKLAKGEKGPCWEFNGNLESPTFTPSLHYVGWEDPKTGKLKGKCHLFLKAGIISYLGDSSHGMAGKKLPLLEMP